MKYAENPLLEREVSQTMIEYEKLVRRPDMSNKSTWTVSYETFRQAVEYTVKMFYRERMRKEPHLLN